VLIAHSLPEADKRAAEAAQTEKKVPARKSVVREG